MRIGRRVAKVLFWGLVLCSSIIAGGLWFAYWYITDSETAAKLIREQVSRYFPTASLEPGRVRIRPFAGEVVLRDLKLRQSIDGAFFETLRIPWLHIRINPRQLANGQLEAREVMIVKPTLRLRRRRDGTWNLEGLLADPWPGPWIETPPILIRDATLELIPEEDATSSPVTPSEAAPAQLALGTTTATASPSSEGSISATSASSSPLSSEPSKAGGVSGRAPAILRDVALKIEATEDGIGRLKFEGSARGDVFDRLTLNGTIDLSTGSITLGGNLSGLTLSKNLRRRIPAEARSFVRALALNNGVIDFQLNKFSYNPMAPPGSRLHYQVVAQLREGVWECPHLPFSVNDLSALLSLEDDVLLIKHAQGSNGLTTLRTEGVIHLGDPKSMPMDLHIDLFDLELDSRLRKRTPPEYDDLWDVFKPRGRVNAALHLVRPTTSSRLDLSATVFCRDVAAVYRHFPYALDHLTGRLTLEKNTLAVDLQTVIGGQPMRLSGTIQNPGVDAVVRLDIRADSVPIDDAMRAMRPDDRRVVEQFNPRGLVKVHAAVFRTPMFDPEARPEGLLAIHAEIDLNDRCEMTWDRLPYPIRNLRGRLEVHPDKWTFKNMRGSNGQAMITASGSVEKLPGPKLRNGDDPLKIDVYLQAQNLPFSGELHAALPQSVAEDLAND